jgi:hypothetical protein
MACGGATSTSSIDSGFPASHATAAAMSQEPKPVSPLSIIPNNNAGVSSQINANFVGISQDRERTFALDHLPSSRHCRRSLAPRVHREIKIDLCCFVYFAVRWFGEEGRRGEPCIYILLQEEESTSN